MRRSIPLYLLILFVFSSYYSQSLRVSRLNEMIRTEYLFAEKASETGTRDAFLEFIADEGILFRPTPVNGKEFLTKQNYRPGLLSWYPVYAYMSNSGDMGCTTGPTEFRKDKDSLATWFGNFCTVWQLKSGGEWKFLIDTGISNNKPDIEQAGLNVNQFPFEDSDFIPISENQSDKNLILRIDNEFNDKVLIEGIYETYNNFINDNSRLLREEMHPITGIKKIAEYNKTLNGKFSFIPIDGNISIAGDFGYVYGSLEIQNSDAGQSNKYNYLRIWCKEVNEWKILIEVFNPLPK